jgi:uncharacterized protein
VTPHTITLSTFAVVCCAIRSASFWFTAGVQFAGTGTSRPACCSVAGGSGWVRVDRVDRVERGLSSRNITSKTKIRNTPTMCRVRMPKSHTQIGESVQSAYVEYAMSLIAAEALHWIDKLHLQPHPEGGFFRETYRAPLMLPQSVLSGHGGDRSACTAIYFLLAGDQFSAFHRICSDELWHFYSGSGLIVHVITPAGEYQQLLLGTNSEQGEQFQSVVPAGCWFASSLRHPASGSYALVGCTVAPGFDFADFEMAKRDELIEQHPQHREIIERLTR